MDYLLLVPTVAAGICGTLATRASRGLRRPVPALVALVSFTAATLGLARLVLTVPVAIVYPVWAGLASVTLLAIDWLVFKEQRALDPSAGDRHGAASASRCSVARPAR